jgi:hypothetical protein
MQFKFKLEDRNTFSYTGYREMLDILMADGKTTGADQSEAMIAYTKMNIVRMNRWDKRTNLTDEFIDILKTAPKQKWLVLNEGWCGDAAQNLPVLNKMAELNEDIQLEVILRDENLDIMDEYLTNGGRSIPKLIAIDENNEVLFTWGPRPQKMQNKVLELKKAGLPYAEEVHKMYAKDRAVSIQEEFMALLRLESV